MAAFNLNSALALTKWTKSFTVEFVRKSAFKPYMGGTNSVIRVDKQLKSGGERIRFAHVKKIRNPAVTGGATLKGSESALPTGVDEVQVGYKRNAVLFTKDQTFKTDLDLLNAAKGALVAAAAEDLKNDLVNCFTSFIIKGADSTVADTSVLASAATAAQRNAHLDNNADRIYVAGGAITSGSYATTLASATDGLTAAHLMAARDMALKTATGTKTAITPLTADDESGRDTFVFFVGLEGFNQLKLDPSILAANKDARPREVESNPLFMGGDLYFDGIIIRRVMEMPAGEAYLAGQNAVVLAWGDEVQMTRDTDDYGFQTGVGYEECRGAKIASLDGVSYGAVRVLFDATV